MHIYEQCPTVYRGRKARSEKNHCNFWIVTMILIISRTLPSNQHTHTTLRTLTLVTQWPSCVTTSDTVPVLAVAVALGRPPIFRLRPDFFSFGYHHPPFPANPFLISFGDRFGYHRFLFSHPFFAYEIGQWWRNPRAVTFDLDLDLFQRWFYEELENKRPELVQW